MKIVDGKKYYDENEYSDIIEKGIMEQADILRNNLRKKRNKNNSVKEVEYD